MSQSTVALSAMVLFSLFGCAVDDGGQPPLDPGTEDMSEVEASSSIEQDLTMPDKTTNLGSNWCCRARTVFSDSWNCYSFKTIGAWAATKCGAFFAGVPLVDGIRLSKQSCSSVPECM